MDEGLTVVLSPVQLAAVLSGQEITEGETRSSRLWGGLKVLGGSLEMVAAAALVLTPEPTMVTKAGGVVLGAHGSDTINTGLWELWTGRPQQTLTETAAAALAVSLGADPDTASRFATAVDIAVPLAVSLSVGAARAMAVRSAGRVSLVEHEAVVGSRVGGGHTIARHVGKTEAQLRARLVAEPQLPVASSFRTLETAERVLYQGLRANRGAIEAWARTPRPGLVGCSLTSPARQWAKAWFDRAARFWSCRRSRSC